MSDDDDDKPTVVLDLNALKKQKLKQEEELASIVQDLEFAVGPDDKPASSSAPKAAPVEEAKSSPAVAQISGTQKPVTVILFDFQSDFFAKSKAQFPKG